MSMPYISVPAPIGRALRGIGFGGYRSRRTASLDSFSSSPGSSPCPAAAAERGRPGAVTAHLSGQSPAYRARLCARGSSVDYSSERRASWEEQPVTPSVLGYEVMEERSKFTVYKILVRKSWDESWIVFRRYTDFSRLNDKLKEMFPGFRLCLPPKRWFKDNYNSTFLEDRQLGLQNFLQNLMAHKDVANCLPVRDFLCLDDPPGPFDSLEESRAFCETLEECNQRLQKELQEKQREIHTLRKMLEQQQLHINMLERSIQGESLTPESSCQLSAQGSESSVEGDVDVECSATEADQEMDEDDSCHVQSSRRSSCWCGPAVSSSPPAVQITGGRLEC